MKLLSMSRFLVAASLMLVPLSGSAQGQAPVPPMGWNSWNHFADKVTDADVRAAADAMVASGMRDAGYVYVNIDDTWQGKRDSQGFIHPNSKFPDMKALADYVHARGLKLGIYTSPGPKTCAGYEGSYGHVQQDADTYAKWGVDYVKYDLCSYTEILQKEAGHDHARSRSIMTTVYSQMHDALAKTGRPIVLSLCQYGWEAVWRWGASTGGNLWRTTGDIEDNYDSMAKIGFGQAGLSPFAGPNHWNDPDMLEVGNGGMTPIEYRTHMSLWALLAAPLLAGNDLSHMTPDTKSILLNRDVISVDQDPLGRQGDRVYTEGPLEVWSKPLSGNRVAVGIFNRWTMPLTLDVPLERLGFAAGRSVHGRDLWQHADLGTISGSYHAAVPGHGVVMLILQ